MAIGVGAKSGGCRQMTRAPSPWSWPARPHERAPGACSAAAAGALRIRNGRAPQAVRPVTRLNRTRRHPQRPPAAHQRPAPATPPRGVSMELERPFDATVGSRPTTTCNKSCMYPLHTLYTANVSSAWSALRVWGPWRCAARYLSVASVRGPARGGQLIGVRG